MGQVGEFPVLVVIVEAVANHESGSGQLEAHIARVNRYRPGLRAVQQSAVLHPSGGGGQALDHRLGGVALINNIVDDQDGLFAIDGTLAQLLDQGARQALVPR